VEGRVADSLVLQAAIRALKTQRVSDAVMNPLFKEQA
jgi:hypothetical protein